MGRGKAAKHRMWNYILVGFLIVAVGWIAYSMNGGKELSIPGVGGDDKGDGLTGAVVSMAGCPDDGDTSLFIEAQNILNTTGAEEFDVTLHVLNEADQIVTTITDTTSPSATDIPCGYVYKLAVEASDSDSGDNSNVQSIITSPTGSKVNVVNGMVEFEADRSRMDIKLGVEQHGLLQFKAFDHVDAIFAYDTGDADNTVFETDGVTYTDGDNSTAFAISSGGYLHFRFDIQGTLADTDSEDAYMLVAVEAPVDKWNEPSLKYNNEKLVDIKDSGLTNHEQTGLNSYEYVYKIESDFRDDINELSFYMKTCDGCDPTADVEIDLFPAGTYLKTDGSGVAVGAHKDDSTKTVVFTTQDITIDVS